MPRFATTHAVRHSAIDMFGLVADVESYPRFVPLCTAMSVKSRTRDGDREIILARMTVASGFLRESFTSSVTLDRAALTVASSAADGPFRRMENDWRFAPTGEGACIVHFMIDYELRSRTLGLLFGAMLDRGFRKFASAFEARADAVYGVRV